MKAPAFVLTMSMLSVWPALVLAQTSAQGPAGSEAGAAVQPPTTVQQAPRAGTPPKQIVLRGFASDGAELSAEQQKQLGEAMKAMQVTPAKAPAGKAP